MACWGRACGVTRQEDQAPLIIDVQQALADDAWQQFLHCYGRCQRRFIRRKNYKIEVPMNFYHFEQEGNTEFKTKKRPSAATDAGAEPQAGRSLMQGKQLAYRDQTSPEHVGLETAFNNDTDHDQTYNFKFDKTRKATLSVTYQKGYSIGGTANFTLGLPKVLADSSLSTGVSMNVQVTKTTGETFEESFTSSANSEIRVAANSHCKVSVVLEERSLLAEFQMKMVMSMPAKRAPVYIRDGRGQLVYAHNINSLVDVFQQFKDVERIQTADGKTRADAVRFSIEGIVDGMQLSNHVISLSGHALTTTTPGGLSQEGDGGRDG